MIFYYLLYAHSAQFVSLFHVTFQQKKQKPCITQVIHGFCLIWWRLADSNRRPLACEASALTSGARRTGRKPCTARLSIAFSTACSLLLSNPERLRPLLLSYRLIMLLSILLDNTEQLQLFSIIFHHPTAT